MSRSKRALLVIVALLICLPALMLAAAGEAAGQDGGAELECEIGILDGDQCVVDFGPATEGPFVCPGGDGVIEVGDECSVLVDKVGGDTCPADTTPAPDAQTCRLPVEPVTETLTSNPTCPEFYEPLADLFGACGRVVPAMQTSATCPERARGPVGGCYAIVFREALCDQGEPVGDACVIEGNPPVFSLTCPPSPNVFLDNDFCYRLVPSDNEDCTTGLLSADLDPMLCREFVNSVPGPLACAIGFGVVAGRCIRFESPAAFGDCPATATVDTFGLCREPVADRVDTYSCLDGAAQLVGTDCVLTVAPLGCSYNDMIVGCGSDEPQCPDGFNPDASLGGICLRFEPASQLPASCPAGARGSAGACYILVARGPASAQCAEGEHAGNICVITGSAPLTDPDTGQLLCPVGFGLVDDTCVRFEMPFNAGAQCPANSIEDEDGDCRKPVPDAAGAFFCEDPSAALNGTSCVFVGGFVVFCTPGQPCDITCPVGFTLANESCTQTTPALLTAPECPINALGTAGSCYRLFQASPCGSGSVEVAAGLCRFDVDDATGSFYCEDPTGLMQGQECQVTTAFSSDCSSADALAGLCGQADIFCPAGFSIDDSLGGQCTRFEPAEQNTGGQTLACPDGSRGAPGGCYVLVPNLSAPAPFCERGELINARCVVVGDPPIQETPDGPLTCVNDPSFLFQFAVVDGECVLNEPPKQLVPQCPSNSFADGFGECRQPVETIVVDPGDPNDPTLGEFFCADPSAELVGTSCVFTVAPTVFCNASAGACGDTISITVCPVTGEPVTSADECFSVEPLVGATCPDGLAMDPVQMTQCRQPVEKVPGESACEEGSLVDGVCLSISTPTTVRNNTIESEQVGRADFLSLLPTTVDYFECAGGEAEFAVTNSSGVIVASGALIEVRTSVYEGEYEVPAAGTYTLQVSIDCPDGTTNTATETLVFIDPSGFILDCSGDIVVGAEITLSRADIATGTLSVVADGDATIMDATINARNPSISDADGRYRWDVVAGFYQMTASIEGQPSVTSAVLEVPPARADVDLAFSDLNCPIAVPSETPTTTTNQTSNRIAVASPVIETLTAPVAQAPASTAVAQQAPLAVTGSDTTAQAMLSLLAFGAGLSLLGAGRIRRKRLELD